MELNIVECVIEIKYSQNKYIKVTSMQLTDFTNWIELGIQQADQVLTVPQSLCIKLFSSLFPLTEKLPWHLTL